MERSIEVSDATLNERNYPLHIAIFPALKSRCMDLFLFIEIIEGVTKKVIIKHGS